MAIISIKGLTKAYKTKNKTASKLDSQRITAVDNVTLDIEEGEILGLSVPTAPAKPRSSSLCSGLLRPTAVA